MSTPLTHSKPAQKTTKTRTPRSESEEQVRLLLDSTAEAIYGIDMDGNCTFCNAASLRMLGYDKIEDLLEESKCTG